jgi:hypothetical protein
MRDRYLTVEIDKATARLRVSAHDETVVTFGIDTKGDGLELRFAPPGKIYGRAGPGDSQRFFFAAGYGIFLRAPQKYDVAPEQGILRLPATHAMDLIFYYGPTPKEIFEQHQIVTGRTEITAQSMHVRTPDRFPAAVTPIPDSELTSWEALDSLVKTLDTWSLSAVLYPAFNINLLNASRGELQKRAADLASILPLLYGDSSYLNVNVRAAWTPYLVTYLREAYDRGYPLIRPLPVEFSRDKMQPQPDVFMLGDEILLAPMVAPGARRTLLLPRGTWTDVRTNAVYKGNQTVEVEAPTGQVPAFAHHGAVVPIAAKNVMELHYFPSLGGEFFLWEADTRENSQFHASPAGDFTRVEIESQVPRTYEWVIHHTNRPASVQEGGTAYTPARQRSALKPGNWWHDDLRNNLHIMVKAEAGSDRIVNIGF